MIDLGSQVRRVGAGLACLVMLLLAGCDEAPDGGAQAEVAPPPPEVTVSRPLVRRLTEWDEFTGRFEPVQQVEIRARVAGYLQEIGFDDGEIVQAGQTLFVIDPRPYQAAVDRAKAEIETQRAQLTLAQLDQDRTSRLVSTSAAARATLDERNAQLAEASASLAGSEAELRQAELELGFTRVTAPFAGRVSDRRVDVGNLVSDQTLLTTIVQLDPIYLTFDMSESDFLAYQRASAKGDLPSTRDNRTIVQAHLVDEDGWPHEGTMSFVDNVVDQGSGTIRGRATFPNPDGPDHAGPVRAHPHPGLARVRRLPDPGFGDRHRPVAQGGADRGRGRHGDAQDHPAGPEPAGRPAHRAARPFRRRPDRHQRADPCPAGHQGHSQGRGDRARAHRAGGRLRCAFPTSSSIGRSSRP